MTEYWVVYVVGGLFLENNVTELCKFHNKVIYRL